MEEAAAPGLLNAAITRIPRKIKNRGLMIFPIHTVILDGRSEKNKTNPKNIKENRNKAAVSEVSFPNSGTDRKSTRLNSSH